MDNILVDRDEGALQLTFIEAFHPSEVHIKADHWYAIYKLSFADNSFEFDGWFTGNFWYIDQDEILVFEEYVNTHFEPENIKQDYDIVLRLCLIDFRRSAWAKFSQLRKGKFEVLEMKEDGRIIYLKKHPDKNIELEIDMNALKFEPIR